MPDPKNEGVESIDIELLRSRLFDEIVEASCSMDGDLDWTSPRGIDILRDATAKACGNAAQPCLAQIRQAVANRAGKSAGSGKICIDELCDELTLALSSCAGRKQDAPRRAAVRQDNQDARQPMVPRRSSSG